ncbi:MAG: DUF4157 domain-containing protein [Prolixibacteraceae bacterium]|jgi:hypothetical protein
MNTQAHQTKNDKSQALIRENTSRQKSNESNSQFADNRPESVAQRKLNEMANNSQEAKQAAQLKAIANNSSGSAIQLREIEDEELLQGKFITAQRQSLEEEDLLQGKFIPVQMKEIEEEELLQGKFDVTQRKGIEEEELHQGKFITAQRQSLEEEDLLQGKFIPVQMKEIEDEELLQGKFTTVQKKVGERNDNNTGLPDNLKSGIENLSGISINDVKVHYNSDKPEQLNAHAYAQGTDIHVASGQEKHLPHEAWHVVQQKQGRVKPTMQMKGKVNVNDDAGLEKEADVMGVKALQLKPEEDNIPLVSHSSTPEIQLVLKNQKDSGLNATLTIQYHEEEDNGDACSASSKSIEDHKQAIEHYKKAKDLRKRAGKLHQDEDGGHITAIQTLDVKILKRKQLIAELSPKTAAKPKAKTEDKRGASNWFGHEPMGTGGQASWLPGNQSAWEPRKFGT